MIGIYSKGIARIDHLSELLGDCWTLLRPFSVPDCDRIAGWGLRPSGVKARQQAQKHHRQFLTLEDGFLRSVEIGSESSPLSIVVDEIGIYYNGGAPSSLEGLIQSNLSDDQYRRAQALVAAWRDARVSKYNHAREFTGTLPSRYVLVVDQTFGDASIRYGLASVSSFAAMLDAALAENPDCSIVLKLHPEVLAGRKKGHFNLQQLRRNSRIFLLGEDVHPVGLIENAEAVYVVTSQMGFEGLLWGKRVHTFGMPFYAGWGLTKDHLPAPDRRQPAPIENLVHAALVSYPRYIDPETGLRCEVERLIDWMGLQRRMRERFPEKMAAVGFSRWKKPIVQDFFQGSSITFFRKARPELKSSLTIAWGTKEIPGLLPSNASLIRLEDGFLRSVGLGAELIRPLSWVIDQEGMYYDATKPSGLELLLQTATFDQALLARAAKLRELICANGITKYNTGSDNWKRQHSRGVSILVPGQVETDASIRFGASGIRRNLDLLKAVRAANPNAYILYKPHPDVRAALRKPGVGESDAPQWCDEVIDDVPFDRLLNDVDEVHVLTSLSGFEALMRGKRVYCYGEPFYSGWGLTHDAFPNSRRTRKLTLDELVAATLILYPTYISRVTRKFTTPERALEELMAWKTQAPAKRPVWRRFVARLFRKD